MGKWNFEKAFSRKAFEIDGFIQGFVRGLGLGLGSGNGTLNLGDFAVKHPVKAVYIDVGSWKARHREYGGLAAFGVSIL